MIMKKSKNISRRKDAVDVEGLFTRASSLIDSARSLAYRQINETLVRRSWELGKIIAEEELGGENRAKYGLDIIKALSKRLTTAYGKGFTKTNLYNFVKFYELFPRIFYSVSGKSSPLLSWTHYRTLLQELNDDARVWYEKEAAAQCWSVRTLQRNISSQYYFRMLSSQRKDLVESEMLGLTAPLQCNDPIAADLHNCGLLSIFA